MRREMVVDLLEEELDLHEQLLSETNGDPITQLETSNEWSGWRTNLANEMFNLWRRNRQST
jgi:hypothetical protein